MLAEIVGFADAGVQLVPYEEPSGIGHGARVALGRRPGDGAAEPAWRGRVIDAMARPIDGGPPLPEGALRLSRSRRAASRPSAGAAWARG